MPSTPPNVVSKPVANVVLVTVRGPLKLGHAPLDELKETLRVLADSGQVNVVCDLREMPLFDSTGIGTLVLGYTSMKRRGGTLKLCGVCDLAQRMLKTVGLLSVLEVFDTCEQAMASFDSRVSGISAA